MRSIYILSVLDFEGDDLILSIHQSLEEAFAAASVDEDLTEWEEVHDGRTKQSYCSSIPGFKGLWLAHTLEEDEENTNYYNIRQYLMK